MTSIDGPRAYIGKIATMGNGRRILVERVIVEGHTVVIEGPPVKRNGDLATSVIYGTFPSLCTFEERVPSAPVDRGQAKQRQQK